MKLNNKGFTMVEVLVCFVVTSIVMMSLFSTISAFNEKRISESYRSRVYEYKNSVTNTIQEDFIKKGLTYANVSRVGSTSSDAGLKYTVDCILKDGTKRQLIVFQRFTRSANHPDGNVKKSDEFYIEYGEPGELIRETLPNLGEVKGCYNWNTLAFESTKNVADCQNETLKSKLGVGVDGYTDPEIVVAKDFQINNILINVTNEADPNAESRVLSIHVGFYHHDLGTRYGIDIVAPINYLSNNSNPAANFPAAWSETT